MDQSSLDEGKMNKNDNEVDSKSCQMTQLGSLTGGEKPTVSYIALIANAIQSTPSKRMLLSEIYDWIQNKYSFYDSKDKSWRNSVRHNLSLNECFIKSGRSENGKGSYWSIHPANMDDFERGDFRRRHARRRVQKCDDELAKLCETVELDKAYQVNLRQNAHYASYVPMASSYLPVGVLTSMFGTEPILSKEERQHYFDATIQHISTGASRDRTPACSYLSVTVSDYDQHVGEAFPDSECRPWYS